MLFKKKFLSFTRSKISIKSSDLLEKLNLTERLVTGNNLVNIDDDIDFEIVESKIAKMRNQSLNYLTDALIDI